MSSLLPLMELHDSKTSKPFSICRIRDPGYPTAPETPPPSKIHKILIGIFSRFLHHEWKEWTLTGPSLYMGLLPRSLIASPGDTNGLYSGVPYFALRGSGHGGLITLWSRAFDPKQPVVDNIWQPVSRSQEVAADTLTHSRLNCRWQMACHDGDQYLTLFAGRLRWNWVGFLLTAFLH